MPGLSGYMQLLLVAVVIKPPGGAISFRSPGGTVVLKPTSEFPRRLVNLASLGPIPTVPGTVRSGGWTKECAFVIRPQGMLALLTQKDLRPFLKTGKMEEFWKGTFLKCTILHEI